MNRNILVVGAGNYQLSGIKKLKEKGYNVIAVDADPNAIGKDYADIFLVVDIKSPEKILTILKERKIEIISAICFSTEVALRTVAIINQELSLIGLDLKQVNVSIDKSKQREAIIHAKLPCPKYVELFRNDDFKTKVLLHGIEFPFIIKPSDNSGSRGVYFIKNEIELQEKIIESFKLTNYNTKILAEEFIAGTEITVESIVMHEQNYILGISEKKKPLGNYTVSVELFYNSPFIEKHREEIENIVHKFIKAAGFNNTIVHTELIYSFKNHLFYIVESSVRSGGFGIFDKVLPQITGIDIVGLTIDVLLGNKVKIDEIKKGCCILSFFSGNQGKIIDIIIYKELFDFVDGIEYGFFLEKGDFVPALETDGSRVGWMLCYGKDWIETYNKAKLLEYAIRFEIIP